MTNFGVGAVVTQSLIVNIGVSWLTRRCGGWVRALGSEHTGVAQHSIVGTVLDVDESMPFVEAARVGIDSTIDDRGYIAAPQKPGLGYDIDRDKVEDLTLQRF
jgi:L-alanine-DL-glutamate epimerase-like enolase superfamily enzyme